MEISPIQIFYMTVVSLVFGTCVGALNDINRIVRIFFGVRYSGSHRFERLYGIKLPIVGRHIGEPRAGKVSRVLLTVIIFFQDLFLFASAGVGVAVLNYYFNNGRARLYAPIAVLLGALIYYFTAGRVVLYFAEAFVFIIKAIFLLGFELFYYPIRCFVKFFGIFAKKICTNLNKAIAKKQKMVYNNSKEDFVRKEAAHGFVELTKK